MNVFRKDRSRLSELQKELAVRFQNLSPLRDRCTRILFEAQNYESRDWKATENAQERQLIFAALARKESNFDTLLQLSSSVSESIQREILVALAGAR